ncbi:transposase [Virgibacillus sp. DJP39]|uniref:transposase n=1 Tax=Virgibacillus sp. DJP39 TaxID=3409790 RepID=UPI003BB7DEBC
METIITQYMKGDYMNVILVLASLLLPLFMCFLQLKWKKLNFIFNLAGLVSTLIFGNIASVSIYQIIKNKTVFMTNIHAIFLNPFFLITGSYLGIYIVYLLLNITLYEITLKQKQS